MRIGTIELNHLRGLGDKVVGLAKEVTGTVVGSDRLQEAGDAQQARGTQSLKALRKQVLMGLQSRGMNRGQAEEALEADVRYLAVDVRRRLQENRSAAFQEDKGSD